FISMTTSAKDAVRKELTSARRSRSPEQRAADNAAWCQGVRELLTPSMRVAAYSPLGSEPGGPQFDDTVAALCSEVYLPLSGDAGELTWTRYT
ncbi:UNVERIFIED_CONTAM: 5-formyltetrahydrofolate cyclo-ligase, partial [Bacteroidetes bacterium 56_B9]